MLDSNLPTFFLKPATDNVKHHESFLFTQHGTDPEATYSLHHLDPVAAEAKNTYAAAIFDAFNPEVLFGEVLSKPGWTQPSLSQEEIRKNGGLPPPPQPILPTEFTIQLYNPDQQVVVKQQTSKWTGSTTYEFSMPQTSFRTPSASTLDRSLNDPGVDASTPMINFIWKKEGRVSKDYTCFLTGKSTDKDVKKKNREPDIAIALFAGLKEVTIYESNLYRVDMEDYKGLEVVILLGAAVIRDLFTGRAKEAFHIGESLRKNSGGIIGRKNSSPITGPIVTPPVSTPSPAQKQPTPPQRPSASGVPVSGSYSQQPSRNYAQRNSLPPLRTEARPTPPRHDPRTQWEIDAETARLKAQVEAEERERRRQEEIARRRRQKGDEEEARRTQKFLEQEEKERRRRQAEVERETERLRRQFGNQANLRPPAQPQQRHSAPLLQGPFQRPSNGPSPAHPSRPANRPINQGPYLQPLHEGRPSASVSTFFGGNGQIKPDEGKRLKGGKRSFFGLRSQSENMSSNTLRKKQSSLF